MEKTLYSTYTVVPFIDVYISVCVLQKEVRTLP